jgi:hypothetical protein
MQRQLYIVLTISILATLSGCQYLPVLHGRKAVAKVPAIHDIKIYPYSGLYLRPENRICKKDYAETITVDIVWIKQLYVVAARKLPDVAPTPIVTTANTTTAFIPASNTNPIAVKPRIVNLNQLYTKIQDEFKVKKDDDAKMQSFKALKDSLDMALAKSGYTPEEIRRFYVLQYLGSGSRLAQNTEPEKKEKQSSNHATHVPWVWYASVGTLTKPE